MRHVVRVLIVALALAVIYLSPVVAASSASGTAILPIGVLVDLAALAAILGSVLTWKRRLPA